MVLQSYIPMAMGCILLCLPHYLCMFFPSNVTMVIPLTIVWNCMTFKQIWIISHRTIFSWGQSSCFGGETSKWEASIILQLLDGKKWDRNIQDHCQLFWIYSGGVQFSCREVQVSDGPNMYIYIYMYINVYIYIII